jgi:hypothetical protein
MTYNQSPPTEQNHNALYFIVGGLLVLAVIIGAFIFNANRTENRYEPAAGFETTEPATTGTGTTMTTDGAEAPAGTADMAPDNETSAPVAP